MSMNLLAIVNTIMDGQIDLIYLLKRGVIIFITGYFMFKAFVSGKKKAFNKPEHTDETNA